MNGLSINNLNRHEIAESLLKTKEVVEWMNNQRCSRAIEAVVTVGGMPDDNKRVTLNASGRTLEENLDDLVQKTGTYFWMIESPTAPRGCEVSMSLPAPDVPPHHDGTDVRQSTNP